MTSKFNKKLIIIIGLLTSINTFAYDFEVDGICYNIISLPELTCEVTYHTKDGYDFYSPYKGEISIPEIVTFQNREIKVVSIGNSAFRNCNEVTSISIPNSVPSIGDDAFSGCTGLTSITIPNSVTSIGSYAFSGCTGLTSITIPNSITSIKESTFSSCRSLTSVTIPNSVTSIDNLVFYNCTSLAELIFEDGKKTLYLGYNDYVTGSSTGEDLFHDCPLEKLYLGRNLSNYADDNYGYFRNKSFLKTVTISSSVTRITSSAFRGCSGLTSITIPNSVTSIGSSAFSGCTGLTSVTIGNSVTSIDNYAFENCSSLDELIFIDGTESLSLGYNGYNHGYYENMGLFFDSPLKKLYIGRNLIYNSDSDYGNSPFYNDRENRTIESMVISNSVTELHDHILCVNIKHLTFLDGETEISLSPDQRVSNLDNFCLDSLYLGRNIPKNNYQYSLPTSLTHLTIGKNANNLTMLNFNGCNKLYAIESKNMRPPTIGEFSNASYLNTPVIIPHGSINSYLTADVWKNFWNISEAGIESTICDDDISLTIKNGNIIIDNIDSPQVEVYNINGQIVYKGNSTIIPVSTNSLYIVKINNKSYKVIL